MVLLVCSDFDEFEHALRGVDGRYLLKSRSIGEWRLHIRDFGGVTAMIAQNGGASLYQGALPDAYAMLIGLSHTDTCTVNGDRLCAEHIIWVPPGHEFHAPAESGVRWLAIVVPHHEVERWVECDVVRLDRGFLQYRSGRADTVAVADLASLISRAIQAADMQSGALPPQDPASAFHGQWLDAVLAVLQSMYPHIRSRQGRPRLDSRVILTDVVHLMDQRLDQSIRINDFCMAAGISATTLRKMFHQHLGMSPHRYLMLRRLRAIHSALKDAGPSDTISSICSRFGVWDFGRFSAHYRELFGVPPSSVLRRQSWS